MPVNVCSLDYAQNLAGESGTDFFLVAKEAGFTKDQLKHIRLRGYLTPEQASHYYALMVKQVCKRQQQATRQSLLPLFRAVVRTATTFKGTVEGLEAAGIAPAYIQQCLGISGKTYQSLVRGDCLAGLEKTMMNRAKGIL